MLLKKYLRYISALTVTAITSLGLVSCLNDDDIPYPFIHANILEMEVEGQVRNAAIDSTSRTVTLFVNDSVNIRALKLLKFSVTKGATVADTSLLMSPLNLADTMTLTLHIYQDWKWRIAAQQNIERTFNVKGQIGQSIIDVANHTVTANIAKSSDIKAVQVTSIKLGGATAVLTPDLLNSTVDFTNPVTVQSTEYGITTTWTITISQTDVPVEISGIDAWTEVAWIHADVQEGRNISYEYRPTGSGTWLSVPESWITSEASGTYTACLRHLTPATTYEVKAISGNDNSEIIQFTTGAIVQLPNNDFTNWWLDGKIWCPWANDSTPFWGTGNKGATTLGESNTTPLTDQQSITGYEGASLQTKFVGIGILGKLAAGNLFAGTYVRTEGTNGVLSFGRPFEERPTALRATIRYNSVDISHSSTEMAYLKGRPDTCVVWVALTDAQLEIRTKPSDRQLFDKDADDVIAYGQVQYSGQMTDFITVDIPIEYKSTGRRPSYIMVVASASKYGDYFTGGAGSLLLVKKYELLYDYD